MTGYILAGHAAARRCMWWPGYTICQLTAGRTGQRIAVSSGWMYFGRLSGGATRWLFASFVDQDEQCALTVAIVLAVLSYLSLSVHRFVKLTFNWYIYLK